MTIAYDGRTRSEEQREKLIQAEPVGYIFWAPMTVLKQLPEYKMTVSMTYQL
jgi:hypothetical protein